MHGKVKVRTTEQQEKLKQLVRQRKASEFNKIIKIIFEKRINHEWDNELLLMTEKLLIELPDINTLWNIRREVFLNNKWCRDKWNQKLKSELLIVETSLRENPKSYCVWHHRTWVMEQILNPDWKEELNLCNKCLSLDERNFHCWDYRQFVVTKSNVPNEEELEFTTTKILGNFSNYSSWHYRSKLLQRLQPKNNYNLLVKNNIYNEELDLVMNATFTDPDDSSVWFYQRWLLDLCESPFKLWRVVLTKTSITAAFYKEVPLNLKLFFNKFKFECNWKSANGKKYSIIWYAVFEKSLCDDYEEISLLFEENMYKLNKKTSYNWIYQCEAFNLNYNNSKLYEFINNYQILSKMEPSNKWAKLINVFFVLNYNINEYVNIIEELNILIKIDSFRANYYKDLRSKCILQHNVTTIQLEENKNKHINLSGMQLTTISMQEPYLAFFNNIDLSNNFLQNQLYELYILRECILLDLSNNNISSLKSFPTLHNLKILLLSNNKIKNHEEVFDLIKRHNLNKLNIKANPYLNINFLIKEVKIYFPLLEMVSQ